MIQDFIAKHTFPRSLMPAGMFASFREIKPANCASVNGSHVAWVTAEAQAENTIVVQEVIIPAEGLGVVDRCIAVSGAIRVTGDPVAFVYRQERPKTAPNLDKSAPIQLIPIQLTSSSGVMSFKDAVSIAPCDDPINNGLSVGLFWVLGPNSKISGVSGVTHVVEDAPVFQPNK